MGEILVLQVTQYTDSKIESNMQLAHARYLHKSGTLKLRVNSVEVLPQELQANLISGVIYIRCILVL